MKKLLIFIFCLCASLIITVFALRVQTNKPVKSETESTSAPMYTLKDYNGKLAIFPANNAIPSEILDTYTESLPELDRQTMKNGGIHIYSESQLIQLIEDYTS